jgi:hypothetical protein
MSTMPTYNYVPYQRFSNTADATANDWDKDSSTVVKAESDAAGTTTFNNFEGRDPDLLGVDEVIKTDDSGGTHKVEAGDTLSSIAKAKGVDVETLMKINGFDQSLLGQRSDGDYYDRNVQLAVDTSSLQLDAPKGKSEVNNADKDKDKDKDEDLDALDGAPPDEATTTDSGTPATV